MLTHNIWLWLLSTACVSLLLMPDQQSQSAHDTSIQKCDVGAVWRPWTLEPRPAHRLFPSQDRASNFTGAKTITKKNKTETNHHPCCAFGTSDLCFRYFISSNNKINSEAQRQTYFMYTRLHIWAEGGGGDRMCETLILHHVVIFNVLKCRVGKQSNMLHRLRAKSPLNLTSQQVCANLCLRACHHYCVCALL